MAALIEVQPKNTTNINTSKYHDEESWQVSAWAHRAWFAGGCAAVLISLVKTVFLIITNSRPWLDSMFAAFISYITADLASGIYHWAIDNYGSAKAPIFRSQIEAFQGHHQQPWAITTRQLANSLYIPAATVTTVVTPINLLLNDPVLLGFVGVFAGCVMFSSNSEKEAPGSGGGASGCRNYRRKGSACGSPPSSLQQQLLHRKRSVE